MIAVDRRAFLAVLGKAAKPQAGYSLPLTRFTADAVRTSMPAAGRAVFVQSMSGGDDQHTATDWWVPGIGRGTLVLGRQALATVLAEGEPWESARAQPMAELEQLGLFG